MNKDSLRKLIADTLTPLGLYSGGGSDLIMGTIAQESALGKYRRQLGGGPALGIGQMEPNTINDIWANYLSYRQPLAKQIESLMVLHDRVEDIVDNDRYAIAMIRCQYRRAPEPIPEAGDIEGMARIYKLRYNTPLGAATEQEFIDNYNRMVA